MAFLIVPLAVVLGILLVVCGKEDPSRGNLLLITVDTLRVDHLGCYGNPLGLTPNLDRLAQRGLVFTSAYSSAPSTFPSVTAILTGRHPEEVGALNNNSRLGPNIPTLATHLREKGWKTGAVVSNFILSERSGLNSGFDLYDANYPQTETNRGIPERIAKDTTDAALTILDRLTHDNRVPVFLWVHYQDPHGPYTPPENRRARFLAGEQRQPGGMRILPVSPSVRGMGGIPSYQFHQGHQDVAYYRAGYDGEVHYMDEEVGRLLKGWGHRGLLDETVIVFTSDHGESLGEDNYWFAHGEYLSDVLVHVPLLIILPDQVHEKKDEVTSLVDLLPTLTDLFGIEIEGNYPGRNILVPDAGEGSSGPYFMTLPQESTVPRFGLMRGGYKYILSLENEGSKEKLVRLGRDDNDVLQNSQDLAKALRAELDTIRDKFPVGFVDGNRALSASDREKLRALGYLSD
jgi:arylsulfatase